MKYFFVNKLLLYNYLNFEKMEVTDYYFMPQNYRSKQIIFKVPVSRLSILTKRIIE